MLDISNILSIFITLFAVINIIGAIPLIIKLRESEGHISSLKGTIISTIIMLLVLFMGKYLFNFLGIEINHFGLAGSILILYFGLKMVLGIEDRKKQRKAALNAAVFPIAFPLIAGAGTLSTIMSLRSSFNDAEIVIGILINSLIIYAVLKLAEPIRKKIGISGLTLIERFFGIILIAIGMKMFLNNLIISIDQIVKLS